ESGGAQRGLHGYPQVLVVLGDQHAHIPKVAEKDHRPPRVGSVSRYPSPRTAWIRFGSPSFRRSRITTTSTTFDIGSSAAPQQCSSSSARGTARSGRAARYSRTANFLLVSVSRTPARRTCLRALSSSRSASRSTEGRAAPARRHSASTRAVISPTANGLTR